MTDPRGDGSIAPETLRQIVRNIEAAKADADEARSEMGNLFKNAENDHGVNRMALKQAIKLKNMEPLRRADWLRRVESYCHILGVDAQHELELVSGEGEQEPTPEAA